MDSITFTPPPNHRKSKSCGTCSEWEWGYEGEGKCLKYPAEISAGILYYTIYENESSTRMCDDWAEIGINNAS